MIFRFHYKIFMLVHSVIFVTIIWNMLLCLDSGTMNFYWSEWFSPEIETVKEKKYHFYFICNIIVNHDSWILHFWIKVHEYYMGKDKGKDNWIWLENIIFNTLFWFQRGFIIYWLLFNLFQSITIIMFIFIITSKSSA